MSRWSRLLVIAAVGVVYAGASAASALLLNARTDLDISFWPSALIAAHGDPLHVYTAAGQSSYPNANGPLSLVPLSLVAWIASRLGFASQLLPRAALTLAVFSVFTVLLAVESARLVRLARDDRLGDRMPLAAAGAVLLAPPLWLAVTGFGHVEMPLQMWLLLLGVRLVLQRRSPALAGLAIGLALLSRSTTLLYLIPIAVYLISNARLRHAGTTIAATVLTAAAGVAPFLIADRANVMHSLFTYRGALPINGGTLWYALRDSPVASLVQHADALIAAGVVLMICVAMQLSARTARDNPARLLAMLAVAGAAFPMLAKTTLSYYMFEPYMLAAVWSLAQRDAPRTPALLVPVTVLLATLVADMGVDLPRITSIAAQGVVTSALLALCIAVTAAVAMAGPRLLRRHEADRQHQRGDAPAA